MHPLTKSHRIGLFSLNRLLLLAIFLNASNLTAQAPPDPVAEMTDSEISRKVSGLGRIYRLDSAELAAYDKIITFEKEVYVGKIYNITFSDVRFTLPNQNQLTALGKSHISQILYADGRRDVFIPLEGRTVRQKELVDSARIIIKNQKDWMKVIVTEDPAVTAHLTAYGNLKANYEAAVGNASNEELMRQAGIILKKRAAMIKAHCVLIETAFFRKSYGDLPSVEVTARAFGY